MAKVVLKPLDDGQKAVEIPIGKTVLGRGPFLGCGDKKVSRNHAVLEVTEEGDVFLTPIHVNPCFFRPVADNPGIILKKDKPQRLDHGDTFSLLPRAFRYQVVVNKEKTEVVEEKMETKTSEKTNGSTEEKVEEQEELREEPLKEENSEVVEPSTSKDLQDSTPAPEEPEEKSAIEEKTEEQETHLHDKEINENQTQEVTKQEVLIEDDEDKEAMNGTNTSTPGKSEESSTETKNTSTPSSSRKRVLPEWLLKLAYMPKQQEEEKVQPTRQRNRERQPLKKKQAVSMQTKRKARKKSESELDEDEGDEITQQQTRPGRTTGRSSRQNRQTRQGLSLDDFIVSDDDEWESDRSEAKPKRRRGQRKGDDSGSDWEAEHRKKRRSRKADTDSESESDWEASRKKKAPIKTRRRRSRRAAASDGSEGEASEEKPSTSLRKGKRTPCTFGKKCYRKNPSHFERLSHPGDADYTSEPEPDKGNNGDNNDEKPECEYGIECYRKNPQHKKDYKHTKKVRPQREAAKQAGKKNARSKADEDSEPNSLDVNDSLMNDESDEFRLGESESDWNPDGEGEGEDVKRLVAEAKDYMKNKKIKKRV